MSRKKEESKGTKPDKDRNGELDLVRILERFGEQQRALWDAIRSELKKRRQER